MKKIYGIAFASAALMLASCSNESEPGGPNINQPEGPCKYLSVNINAPAGTRDDAEYEIGKDAENKVQNLRFIILRKTRTDTEYHVSYSYAVTDGLEMSEPGNYPSTVERLVNSTIIIPQNATAESGGANVDTINNNLKLLVIANYTEDPTKVDATATIGMSESDLLKTITDKVSKAGTEGSFTMTNSAYKDGTEVICAQTLYHKNLFDTQAIAKANPIEVYVERVVARADVGFVENYSTENLEQAWENDMDNRLELVPVIEGMAFYADPVKTLLFKDASWNISGWTGDHEANNHRSFWAVTPQSVANDHFTFNFNTAVDNDHKFTNSASEKDTPRYIFENTLGDVNATKVVVAAQLYEKSQLNDDGTLKEGAQPKDMACVYGQFTTKDGAAKLVANTLKGLGFRIRKIESGQTTIRTINYYAEGSTEKSDLVYSGLATKGDTYEVEQGDGNRTYLALAALAEGESYVQEDGIDPKTHDIKYKTVEASVIEKELKDRSAISYWNAGRCYYYTDINHIKFTGNTDKSTNPGVVRNHVYKIEFTGISGYGTPVFDPAKIIIPTPPTYTDTGLVFLAARINILKWRVVKQQTILGGKK